MIAIDPVRWGELTAGEPGYDPRWWAAALTDGRFAGGFPADVGGKGTFADLVDAISATAAAGIPAPLHNGLVQSGFALVAAGEAGRPLLRELLDGSRRFAFCLAEPAGGDRPEQITTTASEDGVLDGTKCWVPYAGSADVLLVLAREGLFAVDAAAAATVPIDTLGRDRQRAITLSATPATPLLGGGAWEALRPAIARGRIALAADATGAAEAAMRHAAAWVSEREQWGSPLGALQAVKQHCADMLIDVTQARGAVAHAAALVDAGADAHLAAAAAKVLCVERGRRVSAVAHQLCGGEGIHADRPLHVWYRRIKSSEPVLGSPRFLRSLIAADVLD